MKALLICLMAVCSCGISIRGQDASPSNAPSPDASEIPKGYEIGDEENRLISPDVKYAVLFPVRNEASDGENGPPYLPNLLVRLKPYTVLAKVRQPALPIGWRDKLLAEWNGNMVVAVYVEAKWGIADLSVYEIDNDKLDRRGGVSAQGNGLALQRFPAALIGSQFRAANKAAARQCTP